MMDKRRRRKTRHTKPKGTHPIVVLAAALVVAVIGGRILWAVFVMATV